MGVPGFYRTILRKYKGKEIFKFIGSPDTKNIGYFYMDFNPIIYLALFHLQETNVMDGLNSTQFETKLIECIIEMCKVIVNEFVKPSKFLYIAIDGSAPKCKIVTQRARRYKGIYEARIKREIQAKYDDVIVKPQWDRASITPGTVFMAKLDYALKYAIEKREFHCSKIEFSGSEMPSEGEQKITQHLAKLVHDPEETICIYSNDGDMAFLSLRFPEKKTLTMIDANFLPKSVRKECIEDYVYFDNNIYHQILIHDMLHQPKKMDAVVDTVPGETVPGDAVEDILDATGSGTSELDATDGHPELASTATGDAVGDNDDSESDVGEYEDHRILLDFMAISMFGGNDFVKSVPFGKIRSNGSYEMYLGIYRRARKRNPGQYLVEINGDFNKEFLCSVLFYMSKSEPWKMARFQQDIVKACNAEQEWGPFETWSEEWLEYQHTLFSKNGHPEHNAIKDRLLAFSYLDKQNTAKWKAQYYKANFGLDADSDPRTYNAERSKICRAYIKSIIFTMKYYLTSLPPSWRWTYPYHVAPWPSDCFIAMKGTDLSRLGNFVTGDPYYPLEQLLLTVPVTSAVFPPEYRRFERWLPPLNDMKLDLINGEKYIYAEPILRGINEPALLEEARKVPLSESSRKRNRLETQSFVFDGAGSVSDTSTGVSDVPEKEKRKKQKVPPGKRK